jgi:ribosomal protein L7/L12
MALSKEEIFEAIKELRVLELAGLVKDLEEEFGVSAAPPVAMATVQGVAGGAALTPNSSSKSFTKPASSKTVSSLIASNISSFDSAILDFLLIYYPLNSELNL